MFLFIIAQRFLDFGIADMPESPNRLSWFLCFEDKRTFQHFEMSYLWVLDLRVVVFEFSHFLKSCTVQGCYLSSSRVSCSNCSQNAVGLNPRTDASLTACALKSHYNAMRRWIYGKSDGFRFFHVTVCTRQCRTECTGIWTLIAILVFAFVFQSFRSTAAMIWKCNCKP